MKTQPHLSSNPSFSAALCKYNIFYHYLVALILSLSVWPADQLVQSQFISHINARGLRGNFSFSVKHEPQESHLVIEALIESDQIKRIKRLQEEAKFHPTQEVQFDWTLHNRMLDPINACLDDELGPQVNEKARSLLTDGKRLVLDKLNRWLVPLDDILGPNTNTPAGLSSLIWGKSIRLKLAPIYGGPPSPLPPSAQSQPLQPKLPQPSQSISPSQAATIGGPRSRPAASNQSSSLFPARPALSRPHLNNVPPSSTSAPIKPTFAPRPRPSLTGRVLKPSSSTLGPSSSTTTTTTATPSSTSTMGPAPALPKAEALIWLGDDDPDPNSSSGNNQSISIDQPTANGTSIQQTTREAEGKNSTKNPEEQKLIELTNKEILRLYGGVIVCSNIIDSRQVKSAEAVFESQLGGRVTIRANEDDVSLIMINLYHIRSKVTTRHDWKIMASDILDSRRNDEKCKYLSVLFDPNNIEDSECKPDQMNRCKMGDLTRKHGQIQVAGQGKNPRANLVDTNLPLSALEGSRALFLVIYEVASSKSMPVSMIGGTGMVSGRSSSPAILSCAQISPLKARKLEATFNMDGVRGSMQIGQRHASEPATISYDLFGLEGNIKHLTIRELPLSPRSGPDNERLCSSLGQVFNPGKVVESTSTSMIQKSTFDAFRVGNLSGKHGPLAVIDSEYEDRYMGEFMDSSVQLFGLNTVAGRSVLIQKNTGDPWVCATLNYLDEPVSLARASFHYPVVGQVLFQQLSQDSHAETGVLVELYNPNSDKGSENHNWLVHLRPAMADFYNWSQRCQSAGDVYDPIQASVGLSQETYARQCQTSLSNEPLRCRAGDTSLKGGFKLALPNSSKLRQRYYYTDPYLPLSGLNSILGRSVVVYDDQAPTQRGNRLACSTIKAVHPIKASVKSWNSGPSIPSNVRGLIGFEQESSTKQTRIKIDLTGFNGNVENYAIHNVWTMEDREFPCSNDSLYGIFDPFDVESSLKLPPSAHYGSLATVDRVKIGDLSRKHGNFEGLQSVQRSHLDANAPLFAPNSIVGRSVVLRASVNDFRWVCGNIELDLDKGFSREIVAIASFDEPRSKVAGYVRFVQIEHKDGSLSDTFVQVDLKLQSDGIHELQTSEGHNWSVFVNQVGEDAYITADDVRCIAAGFKWNPYLAQDQLETYPSFCNRIEQLGCAMGDLGMRHGPLTLGPNNRVGLSDSNLPLVGNYSIMGRSLVIFDNKRPSVKLACANIYPDIHLKSNVVIKRSPSLTVAKFIEQMRTLLGAADWLMVPELRATKSVANGECVQMTIHFYGQKAHQMQVELNNLITLGTVRKSTRSGGVDKISTHYKLCRAGEMQLASSAGCPASQSVNLLVFICWSVVIYIMTQRPNLPIHRQMIDYPT